MSVNDVMSQSVVSDPGQDLKNEKSNGGNSQNFVAFSGSGHRLESRFPGFNSVLKRIINPFSINR